MPRSKVQPVHSLLSGRSRLRLGSSPLRKWEQPDRKAHRAALERPESSTSPQLHAARPHRRTQHVTGALTAQLPALVRSPTLRRYDKLHHSAT